MKRDFFDKTRSKILVPCKYNVPAAAFYFHVNSGGQTCIENAEKYKIHVYMLLILSTTTTHY